MKVAVFVSPHGFGHAARISAILSALAALRPQLKYRLMTTVPSWFFEDIGLAELDYREVVTDIGLVQKNALVEDLPQTAERLRAMFPVSEKRQEELRRMVEGCALIISDISPLGLIAARAAGIRSVLVENFTWDVIYDGYRARCPELGEVSAYLREIFSGADFRIRPDPSMRLEASAIESTVMRCAPIARPLRVPAAETRRQLGVSADHPLVLVTMGGVSWNFPSLQKFYQQKDFTFVLPGSAPAVERRENAIMLPHRSGFHHPDLIEAADLVVGKLGYSTVAEVYQSGSRFVRARRNAFCESPVLEAFCEKEIPGLTVWEQELEEMSWLESLPELLALPRRKRAGPRGAEQAAEAIAGLL